MSIVAIQNALMIIGGIAIGLPALLAALSAFFILVPGPHPEDWIEAVIPTIKKISDFIAQFSKK